MVQDKGGAQYTSIVLSYAFLLRNLSIITTRTQDLVFLATANLEQIPRVPQHLQKYYQCLLHSL